MTIILNILAALWSSQIGRMALVAIVAGGIGYAKGFEKGDEGRARLAVQYQQETQRLVAAEAAKAKQIQEESDREAIQHELEMAERDRALEEMNAKIAEAEKETTCKIGKATIRALNSSR